MPAPAGSEPARVLQTATAEGLWTFCATRSAQLVHSPSEPWPIGRFLRMDVLFGREAGWLVEARMAAASAT